jgi:hypothetical protein
VASGAVLRDRPLAHPWARHLADSYRLAAGGSESRRTQGDAIPRFIVTSLKLGEVVAG